MATQVGVGEVAIVPTIKGFRRAVEAEVDSTTKQAKGVFEKGFASAGTKAGTDSGKGFHQAFSGNTKNTVADLTKSIQRDVAKASREVSAARLREQDAAGKVRLAETQLAEARSKYASDSSQAVRAEERRQSAQRQLADRQGATKSSTERLKSEQARLAAETDRVEREMREAGRAADQAGSEFRGAGEDANSASGEMSTAGGAGATGFLGSLKGGLGKIGGVVLAAVAAAGIASLVSDSIGTAVSTGMRAAMEYVQTSVSLASDLEQSVGAVDQVFKENSATIQAWAADSAQNVGLSTGKYQEFAIVVGAQLKNMGLPLGEVTEQTGNLIGIGADLAAQFGGPTSEAVQALSSALRGERDPIERYGVSIKQADVNARVAAMGLGELEGEALKAAEAQATLALITEQTADAQGTFSREANTLAGQQARLTAEWENAQARLGTSLLPALTELAMFANDELVPILNDVIDEIGPELGAALMEAAPSIAEVAKEFALILPDLVDLGVEVLPVLVAALKLLTPLLLGGAQATGEWFGGIANLLGLLRGNRTIDEFGAQAAGAGGQITLLSILTGGASGTILGSIEQIIAVALKLGDAVGRGVGVAIAWVQSLPQRARDALGNVRGILVGAGQALIEGFIDGIRGMIDAAGRAASSVLEWVRGFFPFSPAKRGPLSGNGWWSLKDSGAAVFDRWGSGLEERSRAFSLPSMLRGVDAMTLNFSGTPATAASAVGSGSTVVNAPVSVNVIERDPNRVGRQIARSVGVALGNV
mgnify:CR=1 FL=1